MDDSEGSVIFLFASCKFFHEAFIVEYLWLNHIDGIDPIEESIEAIPGDKIKAFPLCCRHLLLQLIYLGLENLVMIFFILELHHHLLQQLLFMVWVVCFVAICLSVLIFEQPLF